MPESRRLKTMLVAAASSLLLLIAAAPSQAAKLRVGFYDCQGATSGYVSSVQIKAGGEYRYGLGRKNKQLIRPTQGRYQKSGETIKWLSGTFKRAGYVSTLYISESSPKGYFSLDRKSNGTWTGISCYWVET